MTLVPISILFSSSLFHLPPFVTWVVDRLSTCLFPSWDQLLDRCPFLLHTTQNLPNSSLPSSTLPNTPPLHRVPVRHSDRSRNNRHKGLKRPNSLSRRDLQLHPLSHHSSHFIFSGKFFFLSPLQDPRSTLRRPTVLASSLPPNFPLSDGDVIAIWKTPPRTLRSLTDPDYAQLPAIALAIGRSVFRGCDCLNLVRRLRERQREKE